MPRVLTLLLIVLRRAATRASEPTFSERKVFVMSQIMYNYPAMMAHAADMAGYAGTLQSLGADISGEQAALQAGWQGDTGMSYQAWQAQWNQAMEQLVLSYRAMAGTHENNTTSMLARDQAEGAKWGG
jgi:WXG100 family type VII secretion target